MEPPRAVQSILLSPPSSLSERELALIWKHWVPQRTDISCDSDPLQVLDPGRFCPGEGPDFQDVRLRVNGVTRVGSVEIHRSPAEWYRHGHHTDRSFNTVILHVCDRGQRPNTRRQDGVPVPILPLRTLIQQYEPPEQASFGPSTTGYDFKRPCVRNPRFTSGRARTLLRSSARAWLGHRAARLRRLEPDRRLWQPLVESLGYTQNHASFRRLAQRIQPRLFYRRLRRFPDVNRTEAFVMGLAGWLPRPFDRKVNRIFFERRAAWETAWRGLRSRVRGPADWNRGRVRPQSYPLRRWVQFGWASRTLEGSWKEWVRDELLPIPPSRSFRGWVRDRLDGVIQSPPGSYWNHHYIRGDDRREGVPQPLGQAWYDQMTINVLVPFCYLESLRVGDAALRETVKRAFFEYPPVLGNRRTRRLLRLWQLEDSFDWDGAAEQQGAVFLWKQGCEPGRCLRCDLNPESPTTTSDAKGDKRSAGRLASNISEI